MPDPFTHLEDFSEDIIAKAQDGLRMTNRELADRAGIELSTVKALKNGSIDEEALIRVASALQLHGERLITSARKSWLPETIECPHLTTFTSEFRSMTVNAYLLTCPDHRGVLFDTGVDAQPIFQHLEENEIELEALVLTHGHLDHVAVMEPILKAWQKIPVFAHPSENIDSAQPLHWGESFEAGPFRLRSLSTPGHTPGGTSFFVEDQSPPIAIVGDALFAGSVGGCAGDYDHALQSIRENILTLPPETILCPGHGPTTTVAEEKQHNPFFPN
ncbi:MBL fold metallo-hydrolase [Puniceicoccus vermicola]|uniref:MBL fold metallo-hydrolase n=1 Tax=Puniceicoccus vermicola TaxID=388746 RepID=A0A7X1AVS4_9BACT|nr:MBL fold metallo-hydrolase [Puniceicoccus vermicola]MBC2600886.1 MBL fold metallo-hydrolase [Puniceicoccus vermicola]